MAPSETTSGPTDRLGRAAPWLDAVLAAVTLAAAGTWVFQFGQLERAAPLAWLAEGRAAQLLPAILAAVQWAAWVVFGLDRLLRVALATRKADQVRAGGIDFALIAAGVIALAAGPWPAGSVRLAGVLYLLVMQLYTWLAAMFRATGKRLRRAADGRSVAGVFVGSMVVLCGAGSLMLFLPAAVTETAYSSWDYVDALFTATSAATCTGLTHKAGAAAFTFFGQLVILLLVQLGALAAMLAGTILVLLVTGRIPRPDTPAADDETGKPDDLTRTVHFVLLATLAFEAFGTILLVPMFRTAAASGGAELTGGQAVWYALFHSVSAFCNAGFTLYARGLLHGVGEGWAMPLRDYWQVHGVIAPLIVFGGLGMTVLREVWGWFWKNPTAAPEAPRGLSTHSRIVLIATGILLVVGSAGLMAIESAPRDRSPEKLTRQADDEAPTPRTERRLSALPPGRRLTESVFQAVSARSGGFNTVDTGSLSPGGTLWLCGLMTVGGAPGGSAGGMKVTTLAVLVLASWQLIVRRGAGRGPGLPVLRKAVTAAVLYTGLVGAVAIGLCVGTGRDSRSFLKLLVEACSACGNVGLTSMEMGELLRRGVELVKGTLIAGMFLGKVGVLALMLTVGRGEDPEETGVVG